MEKMQCIEKIKDGAVQIYSEIELDDLLSSGKRLTIKLGADPSRPDLHLGHTVVLRRLRLFQELGHQVVFVIGDFTGMIGDPSGKNKTRPSLSLEETRKAGKTYFRQVTKILDPEKTLIEYNSKWLADMNFGEVIKLGAKYTVARIMERDDFKTRFENNIPIGLHELFYPLIQAYDSVALNADIEIGGTDQTFNMLVGRTLQSSFGQKPQVVITYPIIPGLDGIEKMSKSLDNYIGIDEPADIMFEKCMKIPDHALYDFFILTTDTTESSAAKYVSDIRNAHFIYADLITTMYHNADASNKSRVRYNSVSTGNIPDSIREIKLDVKNISLIDLIVIAGFAKSKSEARRHIQGNGIKIDGSSINDIHTKLVINKPTILQFGKSKFIRVT